MLKIIVWPVAVVIICTIGMFVFRKQIAGLINRTSSASKSGFTFKNSQQRRSGKDQTIDTLSIQELMNVPMTVSALEREKNIKDRLHEFNLQSKDEEISLVVRILAKTRIELDFCNISSIIYGSQLELLHDLSINGQGIKKESAEQKYINAASKFPEYHSTSIFISWINYLLNNTLIVEQDNNFFITQYGADFLKYLIDKQKEYPRMG